MRALLLVGFVTLAFGLAARQLEGALSPFAGAHVAVGMASLLAASVLGARRLLERTAVLSEAGAGLRPIARPMIAVAAAVVTTGVATTVSERESLRADWTFEQRYVLADATVRALETLGPGLALTLYADPGDPRRRRTRLLLEQLGDVAGAEVRVRTLDDDLEAIDRWGVGASNTVVAVRTDAPPTQRYDWEIVTRPTEGSLFEALARLADPQPVRIYALVGTGEGDLASTDADGFSGLAEAVRTEGYELVALPSAFVSEMPPDAAAILAIAPQRRLADAALSALRRYLGDGGRLLAFLEPGRATGLEALLDEHGLSSPDALVVDPASADVGGAAPGLSPVAFHYADHPITRGLDRNRVVFFQGARAFQLRKPRPVDRLRGAVTTSGQAWLSPDTDGLHARRAPAPPDDVRRDYWPLVAAGEYPREDGAPAGRIVAFGDADVASNRYLRALYNLDLVMNALHWVTERESAITLRPKAAATVQFPLPVQSSLVAFRGVGLLVPELLLLAGGLVWLRQRGA